MKNGNREAADALFGLFAARVIEPEQLQEYSAALDERGRMASESYHHIVDLVAFTTAADDGGGGVQTSVQRPSGVASPLCDVRPLVSALPYVVQWSLDLVQQNHTLRYGDGLENLVHALYDHYTTQPRHASPPPASLSWRNDDPGRGVAAARARFLAAGLWGDARRGLRCRAARGASVSPRRSLAGSGMSWCE